VVLLLQHIYEMRREKMSMLPNAAKDETGEKKRQRRLLKAA